MFPWNFNFLFVKHNYFGEAVSECRLPDEEQCFNLLLVKHSAFGEAVAECHMLHFSTECAHLLFVLHGYDFPDLKKKPN